MKFSLWGKIPTIYNVGDRLVAQKGVFACDSGEFINSGSYVTVSNITMDSDGVYLEFSGISGKFLKDNFRLA